MRLLRTGIFLVGALAAYDQVTLGRANLSRNVAVAALLLPFIHQIVRKPKRGLFRFSTGDVFEREDICRSLLILGAIGTGKTSSSGKTAARALLKDGAGIIVFASKPEDKADWLKLVREAGREADWRLFSPESDLKTNILTEYVLAGLPTFAVADELIGISKIAVRSKEGGESAEFWEQSKVAMFNACVEPLRLAQGVVKAADIRRLIASAPRSVACLRERPGEDPLPEFIAYHRGFHAQVMAKAAKKEMNEIEKHDFRQSVLYWNTKFATEDPKTRSNIESGVLACLDVFLRGVVHDKLATDTNISAADLENGAIWFVDFSPSRLGSVGKFVCAALKRHVQDHCLRRIYRPGDRLIALWADEAQAILDEKDAHFIDQARSHGSLLVYLTQSLSNLRMVLGNDNADALAGEFGHLIAHPVDITTAKYLSDRAGNALQVDYGGSITPGRSMFEQMVGAGALSGNFSEHTRPLIESRCFQTGRTGGRTNRLKADSYVFKIGTPFDSNGLNVIQAEWSQR